MNYLVYVSQAERPMTRQELAELLERSRVYNHENGITGLLIYKYSTDDAHAYFMQLLEGQKDVLDTIFERIAADRRHHTKVILEEGETVARSFPDWSMGFRDIDPADLATFEGYSDLGSAAFWEKARSGALSGGLEVMLSFYED